MNCVEVERYLHPYLDNELDISESLKVDEHLRLCKECREKLEEARIIKNLLNRSLRMEVPPQQLWNKISQSISLSEREQAQLPWWRFPWWQSPLVVVSALAAGLLIAMTLILPSWWGRREPPSPPLSEAVYHHLFHLLSETPVELISADLSQVRAWFQEKVGVAVPVPDLQADGLVLLGARVAHFMDQKVPEMIYSSQGKQYSLSLFPKLAIQELKLRKIEVRGKQFYLGEFKEYQAVIWKDDRMSIVCALVSKGEDQQRLLALALKIAET